jgi:hypothetical protein
MARRVHFCNTVHDASIYATKHGGLLLSHVQHPDLNHKALSTLIGAGPEGDCLVVCDWSMATGWRVHGDDIQLTFADDYPQPGTAERTNAEGRVAPDKRANGTLRHLQRDEEGRFIVVPEGRLF